MQGVSKRWFWLLFLIIISSGCISDEAQIQVGPETTAPPTEQVQTTQHPSATPEPSPSAPSTESPTTLPPEPKPPVAPEPTPPTVSQLPDGANYKLVEVVDGLHSPLYLTHAGDGSGRIFIAEQDGAIKILKNGKLLSKPFLDISDRMRSGGERGLLGLAFHPSYSRNGLFFVHYSDRNSDTVISRFSVTADPDQADPASEVVVLTQDQPYSNHNGGQIEFGPDGYLYIGLGDGGSGGDPHGNGQSQSTLLGKILRIDVDSTSPYTSPQTNPFVGSPNVRPEIWAYGLRNPWRFSFDRLTSDLYIADVGQNEWEEIDFQPAGSVGGENYGWNQVEGSHCYKFGCSPGKYVNPIAEYSHDYGCSVTGGYVYRGNYDNGLNGVYIYGDYCSGMIWALLRQPTGELASELLMDTNLRISSFGEDEEGEIYVVDHRGAVYWLRHAAVP